MQIDRTVELDIDRDELWRLIASPSGWREWLVDDVLGDLVVERGIVRQVRVDEVVEGESIAFTWWEEDDPLSVSHVRLTIDDGGLQILVQHGPRSATRLAEGSPLTRQAVVKHLQALESAGLVRSQRVGREVQFRATPEPLAAAVGWLLDAGASWDRRIDRLRERVSP